MPENQTPNNTPPPADVPPPSRYEQNQQAPPEDKAREMYLESVHDALISQTRTLVEELDKEGGEANKIRDLSLAVLALSNSLMLEERN